MHAGRLLRYPFQKVGQAVGCVEFLRQCDDVPPCPRQNRTIDCVPC